MAANSTIEPPASTRPDAVTEQLGEHDLQAKPSIRTAKPYARPLAEIMADLSKPIAPQHLRTKRKGGIEIVFIPWYYAVKYLDYYAPGWSSEIRSVTGFGERLILTVRLTIPCAEGLIYREASGTEEEPEEGEKMYGDPSSNAESMALRRAAAKFGLGLYLYYPDGPQRRR